MTGPGTVCPLCGGTWWAAKERYFHKFSCPKNTGKPEETYDPVADMTDDDGAFAGELT